MTPQQWRTIEKSLANLTLQEKLSLVTRLMQTIQADIAMSPDRTREQFETLNALRRKLRRDACGGRLRWSLAAMVDRLLVTIESHRRALKAVRVHLQQKPRRSG